MKKLLRKLGLANVLDAYKQPVSAEQSVCNPFYFGLLIFYTKTRRKCEGG